MSKTDTHQQLLRQEWVELLVRLQKAAEAAGRAKKGRAELSEADLRKLAHGLQNALIGFPPLSWSDKTPDDLRPRELLKLREEDLAAAHVLAAREGLIDDQEPNKTVREIFKKEPQTIHNWVNQEIANPGIATELLRTARLHGGGEICDLRIRYHRTPNDDPKLPAELKLVPKTLR